MKFTAYAATMQSVWFSQDEGESWVRPLTPTCGIYNESRCWAVSTHPERLGEVLAGTDQGLYRWRPLDLRWNYLDEIIRKKGLSKCRSGLTLNFQ